MAIKFNPNGEFIRVPIPGSPGLYEFYLTQPTVTHEGGSGTYASGGNLQKLGEGTLNWARFESGYGLLSGNTPEYTKADLEQFQKSGLTKDIVKQQIEQTFSEMDTTGQYKDYLNKNIDSLVNKAYENKLQNPNSTVYGDLWNEYRNSNQFNKPTDTTSQVLGANNTVQPSTSGTGKHLLQKGSEYRVVNASQEEGFTNSGWSIINSSLPDAVPLGTPSQSIVNQYTSSSSTEQAGTKQAGGLPDYIASQAALSGGQFDFETFSDLPADIKNGEMWNSLSQDQKVLAYFTYKTNLMTNEAQKQDAQVALDKAIELADPFFKEQIKIAKAEVQQGIKVIEFSTESKLEQLQKDIADTEETLAFQKENLSIEQQQELSMQLAQNKQDMFSLQQGMAEAGLAFSSPRKQAESNLLAQQQGISMSTKQKYGRAIETANLQAKQAIANAQQSIGQTGEVKQLDLENLALSAEKLLGSTQTPSISGTTKLGGISGTIEEEKQSKILSLQDALSQANTIKL